MSFPGVTDLRGARLSVTGLLALSIVLIAASIPTAALAAGGPEWRITSVSSPTNFASPSPATEVDELTVDATGGTFTLTLPSTVATSASATTGPIPYDASAPQVEAALDATKLGAGAVVVTGGPGGSGGGTTYVLTFNRFADMTLALEGYDPLVADSINLTGPSHSATLSVLTAGASPPELIVSARNVGGVSTNENAIALTDSLPLGLEATEVSGVDTYRGIAMSCSASPATSCTYSGRVDPGDALVMTIRLSVAAGLSSAEPNSAVVEGGGPSRAAVSTDVAVGGAPAGFGIAPGSLVAALSTLQAAAHPDYTTDFALNTSAPGLPSGDAKDIRFDIPVGLVGNTVGMPRCSMANVLALPFNRNACPRDTMIGVAHVEATSGVHDFSILTPVFNISPAPGEPEAFAFNALVFPVRLDTGVLSESTYGVRVTVPNVTEAASTVSTAITIWGVPADHSGPGPDGGAFSATSLGLSFGEPNPGQTRVPLLTNPTQCATPLTTTMSTDPWEDAGDFVSQTVSSGTLSGCGGLPLTANVSMLPDSFQAGEPAGYDFNLEIPRFQDTLPDGDGAPDVKRTSVTLPLGTVLSPSIANGLTACRDDPNVDPAAVGNEFGLHSLSPASCEAGSQIGTVQIWTPLLLKPLEGRVYLGEPACAPCSPADAATGRMIHLLVQASGEGRDGIIIKLEGVGEVNQQTGQVTTTFEDGPQAPFEELKLTLAGGPRAALANPRTCGPATTTVDLTPWSSPFAPDIDPISTFNVEGCAAPRFAPSFTAGTTSNQAGGFSPFTLAFGRTDADQFLAGVQLRMPPGFSGMLSSVKLCEERQATEGTCGAESLIGHLAVATGAGAEPFNVYGGQVFITGPYKGAPYGLSIVVPAKAGPYTLSGSNGRTSVVVRAAINVDPATAALTITSDPFPTALDGIPLQLKTVSVTIDRPGFTFNPTNCDKQAITGSLSSTQGASAAVTSHFQVTNCAALAFKPKFAVSTSGKTSRANGASLDARVTYPTGAQGTQANIAAVKVDLPKQLPSRLTTLQKACPAATFESNPALCPSASVVGVVKASTPILPVGLTGPVIFVSHGGEAFPSLEVILQGDGVRVDLAATTFISRAGITSSTFKTIPDVPISSFELYLPEGPHSALAANGNLCTSRLAMPTAFTAQNGAVIHQSTRIAVTGCPRAEQAAKQKTKAKKSNRRRG
jgi:hypothetical protein